MMTAIDWINSVSSNSLPSLVKNRSGYTHAVRGSQSVVMHGSAVWSVKLHQKKMRIVLAVMRMSDTTVEKPSALRVLRIFCICGM